MKDTIEGLVEGRQRQWRKFFWLIFVAFVIFLIWIGNSLFASWGKISTTNKGLGEDLLGILNIKQTRLKGADRDRVNILLLGYGGPGHPGAYLTDSIMVVSLKPSTHQVALFSLPRDLVAPIYGDGTNKINYAFAFGEQKKKGGGAMVAEQTIDKMLDLSINYYVSLGFQGFVELVDKLGGVTVNVKKAINDPLYPASDMKGYDPFSLPAGVRKFDGKTALKYVRSRETTSDFDRSRRQQEVLFALKEKATSLGILANPKKLTDILSILEQHLRTDISAGELEELIKFISAADSSKIINIVLDNSQHGTGLLVDGIGEDGAYILKPRSGNFKEIQTFVKNIFSQESGVAKKLERVADETKITVENGSSVRGLGGRTADKLKAQGFEVVKVTTAPNDFNYTTIYDLTGSKKEEALASLTKFLLNAQVVKGEPRTGVDFRVVLGNDFHEE